MIKYILSIISICYFLVLPVNASENMKAFPPAEAGSVRHVLKLPRKNNESDFKVELIVGKTMQLDAHNNYFFSGKINKEVIKGWGFPRYIVTQLGPMAGTLMAIAPDETKVNRFIKLGGESYLVHYNSRLPVVVYAPEGIEVRYRVWQAGKYEKQIPEG